MHGVLADRFYREAEASFRKIAKESGLGLGINGRHTTRRHGEAPALTLFGWCGEMAVALIFGLPDHLALIGRGYLLWCAGPAEVGVDPAHLPPALGECQVTDPDDLLRKVSRGLAWLRSRPLAEAKASFARECLETDGAPRGAA